MFKNSDESIRAETNHNSFDTYKWITFGSNLFSHRGGGGGGPILSCLS